MQFFETFLKSSVLAKPLCIRNYSVISSQLIRTRVPTVLINDFSEQPSAIGYLYGCGMAECKPKQQNISKFTKNLILSFTMKNIYRFNSCSIGWILFRLYSDFTHTLNLQTFTI